MATNSEIYEELADILRVTHNNIKYEAKRTNSQLLQDVAVTLTNLTTLVQNISTDIKKVEVSRQLEMNLKNEAYYFIIEYNLLDDFKKYLERTQKIKELVSRETIKTKRK